MRNKKRGKKRIIFGGKQITPRERYLRIKEIISRRNLFPKSIRGKGLWIMGALIEIFGFYLLFSSEELIIFIIKIRIFLALFLIGAGLFIALMSRKIYGEEN